MAIQDTPSENVVISHEKRDDEASASTTQEEPSNMSKEGITLEDAVTPDGDSLPTPEYLTGFKLVLVVTSIALGCFLILLDTMVIGTIIPRITDEFHSLADVGWYASAYQFGMAAPQPLVGKIYTHFKTKWTFLAFFLVFEVGSVICAAAKSSVVLIIGRAVAGLGAAGIVNGAITIISSCVPLEKRPALIGLTLGFQQIGLVLGPIIGGAFTTYSTWRWSFWINLPIGAATGIFILILRIPEQTPKAKFLTTLPQIHRHLDLLGFTLFAPSVIQLLLALQYGGITFAWNSSQVIGLFCGAGVTFIVWLIWNFRQGDKALLPRSLIRRRTVWSAVLFNAFEMVGIYGLVYYLPIYFQAVYDTTAMQSGLYILPMILPQLFAAAITGGVLQKTGYVIPIAIFSLICFSTGAGLMSMLRADSSVGRWVGFQILAGTGSGAGLQLGIISIQGVTTGEELSSGMAFMVFTQALFPAIALTMCNLIFVESLKAELLKGPSNVDTDAVIKLGATNFRSVIDKDNLPGVIDAYAYSVRNVFYLITAMVAVSGLFIWGIGWQDLRKSTVNEPVPEQSIAGGDKEEMAGN